MSQTESSADQTGLDHIHRFVPATHAGLRPILALHGTGGDETDLLPLAEMLAPGAAVLSPRGKVSEGGMPRFFRRLAEGVFDEADVVAKAHALADFVEAARKTYDFEAPIALGFSNGANIAAAIMLLRPEVLAGGLLLRAMVPLQEKQETERAESLAGKPVLIASGAMDPIVPVDDPTRLAERFRACGADVTHEILPGGHGLGQGDLTLAKAFMEAHARIG